MKRKQESLKTTLFPRSSGVLLHVSSLPGDFGIGTFGKEARAFVDQLSEMGCTWWQVLPFGPIDVFNSPYKSLSAFAGNIYFIDPEELGKAGLLTATEIEGAKINRNPYIADYTAVKETRLSLFRLAYTRLTGELKETIAHFVQANDHWLTDYALYQAIQQEQSGRPWTKWTDDFLKHRNPKALDAAAKRLEDEIHFQYFLQYTFFDQWQSVKEYAKEKGIQIMGDMPIYVDIESADVWVHPQLFEIDAEGHPISVAGVPPDYFCEDGQLWGNPLYRWPNMEKEGYAWWIQRLEHTLTLFDAVRIDHFRAFSAYWAVPGDARTAREGKWLPGPGMKLFDALADAIDFSAPRIIAEDLGVMDEGVISLLSESGLPGMGVLQFGFIEDGDNQHLPHNYDKKTVAYTGTHDNNTLLGWLWELLPHQRENALAYVGYIGQGDDWQVGGPQSRSCQAFIRALWQSGASIAIVPIQDLCGFGGDTKMNKPGQADGNWAFRIAADALKGIDVPFIKTLNQLYKR
ncbi:4-alpha-glucanotransferase [Eubacterium barkeri]|uniref:4-alpha-glucanotransferase n=1 Tax=Eubacterium barkeri TaxID=1528 RepID=A0A1H3BDW6_EUBBA|nr:4-alpha-glucanotransferase [Eubacterium barkeri]SDX39841.1 4-alpha-glucanotransferase [Eubacterium barkeri]